MVERGLLTAAELDQALGEQSRSGRLLGQVLIGRGYVGATSLPGEVLHQSTSFLEAADFACGHVQREQPPALEIEKIDGPVRETVWTYREARANTTDAAGDSLVGTFGFDPVRWGKPS